MNKRIKVALKLGSLTPEGKVTKSQGINDSMQSSGNFDADTMPIPYANVQTSIDNLHSAILATNDGASSSISNMHEQERILVSVFNILRSHVEYVANNTADPTTIITSSGMAVALNGGNNAVNELTLTANGNGKITVRVPRAQDEKAFVYEKSADGTTYEEAISSSLSKVSLEGFQTGTTVYVRYYSISKNGKSAVSQAKYIMVL